MAPNTTEQEVNSLSKRNFNWRVSEPKDFSGICAPGEDLGNEAFIWLKKMDRLKKSAKFSDEETLFLVGDHLVKKAETWFNVVGSKAKTWDSFVIAFKKQYLADQEDKWWYQLQTMKQSDNDTIDDIALKMEELFELLENKSKVFQIRTFLSAIRPEIGFEVEKDGTPESFEDAKLKAKRIEKSLMKYDFSRSINGPISANKEAGSRKEFFQKNQVLKDSDFSSATSVTSNDMSSLVAKLEQLSINLVKLNEGAIQRQSTARPMYTVNNSGQNNGSRVFTCFYCREEGHKKYDCPKFIRDQNPSNVATGSNSVPIGSNSANNEESGKGKERQ